MRLSLTSMLKKYPELRKSIPELKYNITNLDGSNFNWKTPIQTLELSNVTLEESLIAEKGLDIIINYRGIPISPNHFEDFVVVYGDHLKLN